MKVTATTRTETTISGNHEVILFATGERDKEGKLDFVINSFIQDSIPPEQWRETLKDLLEGITVHLEDKIRRYKDYTKEGK